MKQSNALPSLDNLSGSGLLKENSLPLLSCLKLWPLLPPNSTQTLVSISSSISLVLWKMNLWSWHFIKTGNNCSHLCNLLSPKMMNSLKFNVADLDLDLLNCLFQDRESLQCPPIVAVVVNIFE